MSWQEMMPEIETIIQADSAGGLIMIFILYMIITFGIFGTVLMMTEERKYEFGVLISIGMSRIRLFGIILVENIILSMAGVFLYSSVAPVDGLAVPLSHIIPPEPRTCLTPEPPPPPPDPLVALSEL